MLADRKTGSTKTVRAGEFVTVMHRGNYDAIGDRYDQLLQFIEDNSYEVAGDVLELGVVDPHITYDDTAFITEIQIPISKNRSKKP